MYHREPPSPPRMLMDRPDPPDAIFVGNDHMASPVWTRCAANSA
jgi:DNA-binding LacI/PurR family transcriptional regulator